MMGRVIQNSSVLAQTPAREDALAIAEAGYAAVNAGAAIERALHIEGDTLQIQGQTISIEHRRIYFVGVGKCAVTAAAAIESLLGERLTAGVALDVSNTGGEALKKTKVLVGTHPLPSETNVQATARVLEFLADKEASDLVIMLVSGGGSTLLCAPQAPMTADDERVLFTALTDAGAPIQDLNTVRKHLSRARGGGLAFAAYPAEVLALVVSDVPGDDIESIASGPSVRDDTTVADSAAVLARYGVAPSPHVALLETPKEAQYFARVHTELFLSGRNALEAMRGQAERLGYVAKVAAAPITGEARELAHKIVSELHAASAPCVLLYAGESTVTLGEHPGKGGRNQELALAALVPRSDSGVGLAENELILAFASDGLDDTDHAGAIADALTRTHAEVVGVSAEEALAAHSSYDFFAATGDALQTGYTGSNVSDLIIAIKK